MSNKICDLALASYPNPPALGGPTQHRPAMRQHVDQMLRAQDNVLTPGRRIIIEEGMRGNPRNLNSDIEILQLDTAQPGFAASDQRTVRKLNQHPITPGHFLKIEARCLSPAMTRDVIASGGGIDEAHLTGATGQVRLVVTWDDGSTTDSVTTILQFDGNPTPYGHAIDTPGAGFAGMIEKSALNFPSAISIDSDELVTWTQAGVVADIQLVFTGGLRPIDVCVYEVPYRVARADGIPASPAHIYQNGGTFATAPEYPIEGASTGDRRLGSQHALNVTSAQHGQLGPSVLTLSRFTGAQRMTGGSPVPYAVTSTSFAPLDYAAPVGGGAESPSFDFSVGSFGRQFQTSSTGEATAASGVCKVKVAIFWKVSGGTGTVRFRTADWSYVDLETTSTSYVWSEAIAHLECGQTVLDAQQLDVLAKISSGSYTASVLYVAVCFMPD